MGNARSLGNGNFDGTMALERDLHVLLHAHDCVIVPGFGGFLTHYRPARLDERRQLVHPPGKDLSFNRHLVRTDGLLTDEVAKREGLDHAGASRLVEREVEGWKARLEREGRLELGRIGTFFRDAERNLQFDPDKRVNYLKDAYGLNPVSAVPLVSPLPAPAPVVVPMRPVAVEVEPSPVRGRASRLAVAASIAALLFTGATWWVVGHSAPQGVQWGGFDLFSSSEPRTYSVPQVIPPKAVGMADTTRWAVPAGMYGVHVLPIAGSGSPFVAVDLGAAPVEVAPPVTTAVAVRPPHARYHIVGGCFLQKENAEKFIADLQARGFAASLIDRKGGLYRVAYGSYPQRSMAEDALNAVRKEEAPSAWLLVQ